MKTKATPGMKRSHTPWAAKLREDMQPAVVENSRGPGQMLLPTPLLVAEEVAAVAAGELVSFSEWRSRLACRFEADVTCPLMTGIFYNIIAGAVEDQLSAAEAPLAPYWRVVRDDNSLSVKTPAGPERQAEHLRAEGHVIEE